MADIKYVLFSATAYPCNQVGQCAGYFQGGIFSEFDNLTFTSSTGGGGGTDPDPGPGPISTPEPASAILLGGALLGLAAGRRRLSR